MMFSGVLCVLLVEMVFSEKDIVIKMSPDKIADTVKSIISSQYLRDLTSDFAMKAAEHFIEQIKQSNNRITNPNISIRESNDAGSVAVHRPAVQNYEPEVPPPMNSMDPAPLQTHKLANKFHSLDPEEPSAQVQSLLRDPAPDGDNLDKVADLTDYEDNKNKKPVKTSEKINGRHYKHRRYHFALV